MKLDAKQALGKAAIDRAIEYAAKDPQKNLPRVLKAAETMDRKSCINALMKTSERAWRTRTITGTG